MIRQDPFYSWFCSGVATLPVFFYGTRCGVGRQREQARDMTDRYGLNQLIVTSTLSGRSPMSRKEPDPKGCDWPL